jgi:hypothetical protein
VNSGRLLRELDGARSEEVCGNFLNYDLADLGVSGGAIKLVHEASKGQLWVLTEYRSPIELDQSQLAKLAEQTFGQWTDGIGEACFNQEQRVESRNG